MPPPDSCRSNLCPCFRDFFNDLGHQGFRPHDFDTNGIALPCTEKTASAVGLPLHRGPHPRYSEIVSVRIASIEKGYSKSGRSGVAALQRIRWLQRGLKKALLCHKVGPLNRRDPLRPQASFELIDQSVKSIDNLIEPVAAS